ncbi:MAG TPA: hypothetical protein VFN35_15965 [Ktedonobacteraceae bacterium]|nr:hypothetical protein [Ktedonobacteraceae bacterium]
MAQQGRPGRKAFVLRDARALEAMRYQRRTRRIRNIFFLLVFSALFFVGYSHLNTTDSALPWLILALVSGVFASFPLSAILIDIFDINGTPRSRKGQNVFFFMICVLAGSAGAEAIQYGWQLFGLLDGLLPYAIGSYFFLVALVTALLIFLVRRVLPVPVFRQVTRQLFVALVLGTILHFALGQALTNAGHPWTLKLEQVWRLPIFFVLIWPIFLLDEGISRGYQERGVIRSMMVSLLFKALLLCGLLVGTLLVPDLRYLNNLLLPLGVLFAFLTTLCTQIYSSGRAAITTSTLCALMLAWFATVTFPVTL